MRERGAHRACVCLACSAPRQRIPRHSPKRPTLSFENFHLDSIQPSCWQDKEKVHTAWNQARGLAKGYHRWCSSWWISPKDVKLGQPVRLHLGYQRVSNRGRCVGRAFSPRISHSSSTDAVPKVARASCCEEKPGQNLPLLFILWQILVDHLIRVRPWQCPGEQATQVPVFISLCSNWETDKQTNNQVRTFMMANGHACRTLASFLGI